MIHSKSGLDLAYRPNNSLYSATVKSGHKTSSYHDPSSSFSLASASFHDDSSSSQPSLHIANPPPPPPLSHPPPPALKQAVPHHPLHSHHHIHYLRSHELYSQPHLAEPSSYLLASADEYEDLNNSVQGQPMPLTQQDHLHRQHQSSLLLPPPPVLQQQQPAVASSSSLSVDPYQEYFQSSRSYASYDQVHPSQSDLRGYNFHDFSSTAGSSGGGVRLPAEVDNFFYSSSSTPVPTGVTSSGGQQQQQQQQQLGQYRSYHDDYLHFQPSPAVLLHIRYVMESICEGMQFTDVTVVTATESVRAHRAILASHSTFLRQLMITNLEDLGENEEPVLVIKDLSSKHMSLMMQFFYNGEVSLSSQDDIQPLKDVCYVLGVSSLMARLEELSFSLQCLPNYEDPFKYGGGQQQPQIHRGIEEEQSQQPDGTIILATKQSMASGSGGDPSYQIDKQVFKSCAKDNSRESLTRLGISNHLVASALPPPPPDVATSNFDTSLLSDDHVLDQDQDDDDQADNEKCGSSSLNLLQVSLPTVATVGGKVKKKAFSCSTCVAKFYSHESLVAHERVHEGKKPFACSICQAVFSSKSHLHTHTRKHSGEKPFACGVCQKSFGDRSAFKRHAKTHGDKKGYQCELCKKEYSDRSTFRRHYKEKHGGGDSDVRGIKKFGCSLCKKVFHRRETMATHVMRVHSKNLAATKKSGKIRKEGAIDKCAVRPLQTDKEEDKWSFVKCPRCEMSFYKKSSMEIHLRTHTGDKPYVCELCGKKFARNSNLKLHSRIHTGEKPHRCTLDPDCSKAFSDVSALKRHLRTHTGEKPYECEKCRRSFSQLGTMKGHEKNCKGHSTKDGSGGSAASIGGNEHLARNTETTGRSSGRGHHHLLLNSRLSLRNRSSAMVDERLGTESSTNPDMMVSNSMMEDNSLSVMAGSEPPVFNTDTLDSVRASCM